MYLYPGVRSKENKRILKFGKVLLDVMCKQRYLGSPNASVSVLRDNTTDSRSWAHYQSTADGQLLVSLGR
jgi:hypothetical protein